MFFCMLILGFAPVAESRVTDMKAFFREGQTFITWKELDDVKGEKYRIYRATSKITAESLKKATLLGAAPEDSGVFENEKKRKVLEAETKIPGYNHRFIIQDNPGNDPKAQLPEGTGLFVATTPQDGTYWHAVVPEIDGKEEPKRMATLETGIEEKVMTPGAVLVWKAPTGCGAVYTHWMDSTKWDPLYEGYAYNFGTAWPENYDGKEALPVFFYGHGMGETYAAGDKASYWRNLWVWIGDGSGSWFFGMMNKDKTKVVNYVEQRIRWTYTWLGAARSNQFWRIDPRRAQAQGHSMGGTMCNAMALRMGDFLCSVTSSEGATIHRRNAVWVKQAERLWGTVPQNLPTVDGTGVWDYQDYGKWSLEHMDRETAFILISHGKPDESVVFEPVPDFIKALEKSKRPFALEWDQRGHGWKPYAVRNEGMGEYKLPLNESLPAFANASNNDDILTAPTGVINGKLEWSASGNDFDKGSKEDDIEDTAERYGINLRSLSGAATVDVTPRRLQKFKPKAGRKYAWKNVDMSDPKNPKEVDRGEVAADKYGLVTAEKFKVGKDGLGNRLAISEVRK